MTEGKDAKPMGFWECWSFSAGVMIGSGVFLLPAVLAPYGSISFLGWSLSSAGIIFVALTLSRLASRTSRTGGMYAYAQDAFGDLAGFIIGWSYWSSVVLGNAAISVAFAGYAGVLFPALQGEALLQAAVATGVIWAIALINVRSVGTAALGQLIMTLMKIAPILVVIALGFLKGSTENIPAFNLKGGSTVGALATTALLTMWAFIGIEGGVIPAGEVKDAKRTIPRAVIAASISVAVLYVAVSFAVMLLIPADKLAVSEAPFSDAASTVLGPAGAMMIAIGALISTFGSANGNLFCAAQTAMAVAEDGLAPKMLARRNKGRAPVYALIASTLVTNALLAMNYSGGMAKAFVFLASLSTLATLMPYAVSALADLKYSICSRRGWALMSLITLCFSIVAMAGAGFMTIAWGLLFLIAGLPIYFLSRAKNI